MGKYPMSSFVMDTVGRMTVRQPVGVDLTQRENELRGVDSKPRMPTVIKSKWLSGVRES